MGASDRMFAAQRTAFPDLFVPPWLPPESGERLEHYAERMAATLPPGKDVLLGGQSFGGMVAVEMARATGARDCVLISSVAAPNDLPRRVRGALAIGRRVPFPRFYGWAIRAIAGWGSSPRGIRFHRIHGSLDVVIPPRCSPGAEIVRGGGHFLLPRLHATAVNDFLRRACS